MTPAVPRTPPRNIQVYNPSPNSLNVRWEPASGQVQQYRVAYTSLTGSRQTESVSNSLQAVKTQTVISGRICLKGRKRWFPLRSWRGTTATHVKTHNNTLWHVILLLNSYTFLLKLDKTFFSHCKRACCKGSRSALVGCGVTQGKS